MNYHIWYDDFLFKNQSTCADTTLALWDDADPGVGLGTPNLMTIDDTTWTWQNGAGGKVGFFTLNPKFFSTLCPPADSIARANSRPETNLRLTANPRLTEKSRLLRYLRASQRLAPPAHHGGAPNLRLTRLTMNQIQPPANQRPAPNSGLTVNPRLIRYWRSAAPTPYAGRVSLLDTFNKWYFG